jgi:hypothetical protein
MAQEIGYWEDNVTYEEGPFVVCRLWGDSGWRIEVENKGGKCPILPDLSISRLRDSLGHEKCTHNKLLICSYCDELNHLVKTGDIKMHEKGYWYCPKHKLSYQ